MKWARVRRIARLTRLTAAASFGLAVYDAAQLTGFSRVHAWIARLRPGRDRRGDPADVVWAVDEACVWYFKRVLCLQRSAVSVWLLRRAGLRAELVIGYRPVPFESHAWVELDGEVINDRPQYQRVFMVLDRL
jgi:hypothetical protein